MRASPRPPGHSRFSSAVQSGTACGWKPLPSSVTRSQNRSRAGFALDEDVLLLVVLVAVTNCVRQRLLESHFDAEVIAPVPAELLQLAAGSPPCAGQWAPLQLGKLRFRVSNSNDAPTFAQHSADGV